MPSTAPDSVVSSPCIGVCTLHANGYCLGCWRTLDEISNWLSFDREHRNHLIRAELPKREQAYCDNIREPLI